MKKSNPAEKQILQLIRELPIYNKDMKIKETRILNKRFYN